jgi:hypothetical protein
MLRARNIGFQKDDRLLENKFATGSLCLRRNPIDSPSSKMGDDGLSRGV